MLLFFKDDTDHSVPEIERVDLRRSGSFRQRAQSVMVAAVSLLTIAVVMACESSGPKDLVRTEEPGYTGLARCALCHTNLYGEWKRSLHSQAMGVPADSTVVGDFGNVKHSYGGVTSRMYRDETGYYMETLGPEGDVRPYRVDYTIGVRQHQAYLTMFPDGRLQVLPLYHDGEKNAWVDAQQGHVVESDEPLRPGDFYFWANRGRSWNYHCYDCHASRVEKHYDPATDKYETTVGSLTIDCEACHGPGKIHDDTRETPGDDLNMVDLERLSVDEQIEVCAQCHAAKDVISLGYAAGESFYDHYTLYLPDDKTFYPDGQPAVYLYPVALHMMSSCYAEADLVCTTCHDPHGSDYEVDLVADKRTTELCASCHEEIAADPTAHSRHAFASEGNTCVGCHMPYHHVTGEKMTDHRIASPSPRNTLLFGVPNSCNAAECHADKAAEWSERHVEAWFPGFQEREADRIRPYAQGKQGNRAAIPELRKRLDASTAPVWRAVSATLLGQLSAVSAVEDLLEALDDPFPMVRLRAAIALGRIGDLRAIQPLVSALADSVRPVRIYAAFALSDLDYQAPVGDAKDAFALALAEYEAMVNDLHRDDPGLLDGLGELRERAGRYDQARELFERIRKLDPNHPETESDLERIAYLEDLFSRGEPVLRQRVEAVPTDFHARARLGRFYVDHYRIEPAGLQLRGAAAQLKSVAVLLAEARVTAEAGDMDGALHSVLKALSYQPSHRTAAQDLVRLVMSSGSETAEADAPEQNTAWGWWETGHQHAASQEWAEARSAFQSSIGHEVAMLSADSSDVRELVGLTRGGAYHLFQWAGQIFDQGTSALRDGNASAAEQLFRDCISLSPSDARGYLLLALSLDGQDRREEAAVAAQEGSMLEPGFADAHSVLGSLEQNAGRMNEAMAHFQTAIAFDPGSSDATLNLSTIYLLKGMQDSARTVLRRLIDLDPQNQPARQMLREIGGAS
jgi:predicted CXXCH cytochrome family protein